MTGEEQAEAFKIAARDYGCDEDEGRFEDRIRKLIGAKHVNQSDMPKRRKP